MLIHIPEFHRIEDPVRRAEALEQTLRELDGRFTEELERLDKEISRAAETLRALKKEEQ